LERNKQKANLRLTDIENLISYPFCAFIAKCPPVEINRKFRCQAPDYKKVSCHLYNLKLHTLKNCKENAKETGLFIRRYIKKAMSAALIKKCNKYSTLFIKKEGCNRMRCTL
jgi:TRIAD3 protein (E3 ubiquitin-protein ligase RNF216)